MFGHFTASQDGMILDDGTPTDFLQEAQDEYNCQQEAKRAREEKEMQERQHACAEEKRRQGNLQAQQIAEVRNMQRQKWKRHEPENDVNNEKKLKEAHQALQQNALEAAANEQKRIQNQHERAQIEKAALVLQDETRRIEQFNAQLMKAKDDLVREQESVAAERYHLQQAQMEQNVYTNDELQQRLKCLDDLDSAVKAKEKDMQDQFASVQNEKEALLVEQDALSKQRTAHNRNVEELKNAMAKVLDEKAALQQAYAQLDNRQSQLNEREMLVVQQEKQSAAKEQEHQQAKEMLESRRKELDDKEASIAHETFTTSSGTLKKKKRKAVARSPESDKVSSPATDSQQLSSMPTALSVSTEIPNLKKFDVSLDSPSLWEAVLPDDETLFFGGEETQRNDT